MDRVYAMGLMLVAASSLLAKPEIKDVQASHGQLGPERKSLDCLRGDELYFRFTVIGFTTNDDGRLSGELAYQVADASGKVVLKDAVALQQPLALGGGTFPGHVSVTLGENMPLGEYTLKVTITDALAKASDSFERKFTCQEQEFALVAVRFWQDPDGRVPATVGGFRSQSLFFKARGIGFDKSKGELDFDMLIEVLDKDGKPIMPKPVKSVIRSEDAKAVKAATVINLRGEISLSRAGDFILKISLVDKLAKKTAAFEAPLKVVSP